MIHLAFYLKITYVGSGTGSSEITVSETGHGAVKNDFVTFSGADSLGGNVTATVLNQEYQIESIVKRFSTIGFQNNSTKKI